MSDTPELPDPKTLSESQKKVLRILARSPNLRAQLSGNNMAPVIASAKALVRKGVLHRGDTSHYSVLDHAREYARTLLAEYRTARAAEKAAADAETAARGTL